MIVEHVSYSDVTDYAFYDLRRASGVIYKAVIIRSKPDDLWLLERLPKGARNFSLVRKHLNPKAWAEALAAIKDHMK